MDCKRELSALIGDIYDCVLNPDRWGPTLGKLGEAFGCERTILSLSDLRRDRVLIGRSSGWDPQWLAERDRHMPEIHAVLQSWLMRGPGADVPFVASRELSTAGFQASPYVRDCLVPLGVGDVAHYFLLRSAAHFSEVVLMRQAAAGPFGAREFEIGELLLPHLRRAVTISKVLDAKTLEREHLAQTLDSLQFGVVLTDRHGAVVHANRMGDSLLGQGELLDAAAGVVRARQPGADQELQQALRLSASDEAAMGSTGVTIRLSRPQCPPVFAHVLPLGGTPLRQELEPQATAALFVSPGPNPQDCVDSFAATHHLTPAPAAAAAQRPMRSPGS